MSLVSFERILCGVDFSDNSKLALDEAVALASAYGASLLVANVVQPIVFPVEYGLTPAELPELETEARQNAEKALAELVAERVPEGIDVTQRVVLGLPSKTLCDMADEEGASVIVVATRGLSGLSHLLLGSTAERIVRYSSCPVLTVKA